MAGVDRPRNRLFPWFVGLAIVLAAIAFVAYRFAAAHCPAPTGVEFMVLGIIPVVYLTLMYLTLTSQK
jgi:hypothetical protein